MEYSAGRRSTPSGAVPVPARADLGGGTAAAAGLSDGGAATALNVRTLFDELEIPRTWFDE